MKNFVRFIFVIIYIIVILIGAHLSTNVIQDPSNSYLIGFIFGCISMVIAHIIQLE